MKRCGQWSADWLPQAPRQAGVTFDGKEPTNRQNPPCSASPATDGEGGVAFFGTPGLYCYDMARKGLWHRSFGRKPTPFARTKSVTLPRQRRCTSCAR
jgi:hypothetical protein